MNTNLSKAVLTAWALGTNCRGSNPNPTSLGYRTLSKSPTLMGLSILICKVGIIAHACTHTHTHIFVDSDLESRRSGWSRLVFTLVKNVENRLEL